MIKRFLLLQLFCSSLEGLVPSPAVDDDNECALYISGPGRSSSFDYNLNLLRGNLNYEGQNTCITYEAVNQAYLEARKRINVARPKGDWKAEEIATVGELVLDISINLARMYGLTYEEIEKGLPLIDTSKTLIREVCPPFLSNVECRPGKYRRFDGLCNNIEHPTWGATMAPFQRLLAPLFADGMNAPRVARSGGDLPLSRVVSRTIHPDDGYHDHAGTVMVIAWGQFMDHDFTLTATPLDPRDRNDPEECCKRPPHQKHPYCNEIRIPEDDYFYRLFGVKCMDFVRAFPSPRPGCKLGSRVPYNTLTGVIDGNTVYGVTEKFARKLRTGYGGLLRMNPVFEEYGLKDLLPLKLDIPDEGCTRPNKNMYCFEAGEIRVNEQLVLTCMHTLMAREHNRIAKGLTAVNPHWDDETLFQEARRIVIAQIQHITYNEFLPILLGKDIMDKFGLLLEKHGYWDGYDPKTNPDIIASFASAAFRFGHSLLPTAVERWSKAHKFIASKRLSELIRRPYDLYRAGVFDEYLMGLMNQVAQAMDDSITQEVTNHLFKKVGARFGMDLVSLNMQRGREFGIPGYMEFRKFCGLPEAHTFQDLFGTMPNETIRKYESIFEHPGDVDLWSGGVSERPLPGAMLGPTFACVIATQFAYVRRGDRFWFELPNQPSSFTPEQLLELRKSRLARIICDNTDIIDTTQVYPMVLPDHELNPRVPCKSGILPSIDLTKWAEFPQDVPQHAQAKHFYTEAILPNATNISADECAQAKEICDQVKETKCDLVHENNSKNENRTHVLNVNLTANSLPNEEGKVKTNLVLKYVFNKNDNGDTKNQAHVKNALVRQKRQTELQTIILNHLRSQEELYNKTKRKIENERNKARLAKVVEEDDAGNSSTVAPEEDTTVEPQSDEEKNKSHEAQQNINNSYEDVSSETFEYEPKLEEYSNDYETTTAAAAKVESLKGGMFSSDSSEIQEEINERIKEQIKKNMKEEIKQTTTIAPELERNTETPLKLETVKPPPDDKTSSEEVSKENEETHEDYSNESKEQEENTERKVDQIKEKVNQEMYETTTAVSSDYDGEQYYPEKEKSKVLYDSNEEANEQRKIYNSQLVDSRAELRLPTVRPVHYETHFYPNNDYLLKRKEGEIKMINRDYEDLSEENGQINDRPSNERNKKPKEDSNEGAEIFSAEQISDSPKKTLKVKDDYEKIPLNYRHDQKKFVSEQQDIHNPRALLVSTPNQYFYFDNNRPTVHVREKSIQKERPNGSSKKYEKKKHYNSAEKYSDEEEYGDPRKPPLVHPLTTQPSSVENIHPPKRPHKKYVMMKIKKRPVSHVDLHRESSEESAEPPKREKTRKIPHDKEIDRKTSVEDHSSREDSHLDEPETSKERIREPKRSKSRRKIQKERPHSGEVSPHSGEERTHSGEERTHSGEERQHSGEERQHSGEVKPHSGEEKPHSGEEKPHSGEERAHSGEETPHSGEESPNANLEKHHSGEEIHHSGEEKDDEPPKERIKETRYQEGERSPEDEYILKMKFDDLGIPEINLPEKITELRSDDEEVDDEKNKKKLDVRDDDFFYKKYKYDPHSDDKDYYTSKYRYDPHEGKKKRRQKDKEYEKYNEEPHYTAREDERVENEPHSEISRENDENGSGENNQEKTSPYTNDSKESDSSDEGSDDREVKNTDTSGEEVNSEEDLSNNKDKYKVKDDSSGEEAEGEVEVEEETEENDYDRDFGEFKNRGEDLYEKFVQANFNKMGSFLERSQKLFEDPSVMSSMRKLIKAGKKSKSKRKKKKPKRGYRWTKKHERPLL